MLLRCTVCVCLKQYCDLAMPRIKIRCQQISSGTWSDILKIFRESSIKCTKLVPSDGCYLAYCDTNSDVDLVFSDEVMKVFRLKNYSPVSPPDLQSRRTVIVKYLDDSICNCSVDEISTDINSNNLWLKTELIAKFKTGRGLKMICETIEMAQRCLREGFFIFNLNISPRQMAADNYINVRYCYRCYAIGEHISNNCPLPADYKICSNCSSNDHDYKNCNATEVRRCINCKDSSHHTLAYSCPKRKQFVESMMKSSPSKPASYSDIVKSSVLQSSSYSNDLFSDVMRPAIVHKSDVISAHILVTVAFEKTKNDPLSFDILLNKLLKENNLPEVKLTSLREYTGKLNLVTKSAKETKSDEKEVSSSSSSKKQGVTNGLYQTDSSSSTGSSSSQKHDATNKHYQLNSFSSSGSSFTQQHDFADKSDQRDSSKSPSSSSIAGDMTTDRHSHPSNAQMTDRKVYDGSTFQIFRRSDLSKSITAKNLRKLASDSKVMVVSEIMSESDSIDYIIENEKTCADVFKHVLSLPIDIFVKKLNSRLNQSPVKRKSSRINK